MSNSISALSTPSFQDRPLEDQASHLHFSIPALDNSFNSRADVNTQDPATDEERFATPSSSELEDFKRGVVTNDHAVTADSAGAIPLTRRESSLLERLETLTSNIERVTTAINADHGQLGDTPASDCRRRPAKYKIYFRYCGARRPRGFAFYVSFKKVHIYCAILFITVTCAILTYCFLIAVYPFLLIELDKSKCYTICSF
ncbi:hypothetical protein BDM02DRAFT_3116532 [Thelephora ganbajun]|uniref:Uncharacterized protein n=1 Tax=Thelephora ganbajun TaxID=370292 RepID=A0ACB6ZDW0_THEGA|nr:hypothetical protein BDM02DRAFT_3116532 [Thelephora ganbajun]